MKNDKKTIFGWCMYDCANSAYITTVIAAILPNYFAKAIVGEAGVDILGMNVSATALWGYMLGTAAFCVFLFAPVLGAIADFSAAKKRFLMGFAYMGSIFATMLYFCESGDVGLTILLFLGSQICFVGGNVFYDAFLPQIASEDKLDSVSARGYAFGYIGGSLQFAIVLALVAMQKTPADQAMAARIGMAMTGIWWAGWTLLTLKYLKEEKTSYQLPEAHRNKPKPIAYLILGISRTLSTAKRVGRFKHLTLFLIAYMIYNDGIHTVTSMATIYGTEELNLSATALMVTLLLVQVVAIAGALIFSRLANRIGAKRSVMFALVLMEWGCYVWILYSYRNGIFCFGNSCWGGPRWDTGVEPFLLWRDDSRAGKCGVLRILFCLQQVFLNLGTRNVRCYRTDHRQCPSCHHFIDDFLYCRIGAAGFCG